MKPLRSLVMTVICLGTLGSSSFAGPERTDLFKSGGESKVLAQIVNDSVMGGISTSAFKNRDEKPAVFEGNVSLKNNGGFASVRLMPPDKEMADSSAFEVRVRGDGQRYKMTVRTSRGFNTPNYQLAFETKKDVWMTIKLPFEDFVPTYRGRRLSGRPELTASNISTIGFIISDKQEGPFKLEIDRISAIELTQE